MIAIQLKNLNFNYKNCPLILKDVNLELNYGEFNLLFGASGCGKTTIIKLLTGIIPNIETGIFSGEIKINNQDIKSKTTSSIIKDIGVVLQNPENQIIHNIVEDEIAFGLENINTPEKEITRIINKITKKLKLNKNDKTRFLSGGEKEKVILASVLSMGQKIIILDEPLANLDRKATKDVLTFLKSLTQKGYMVLLLEHRINMVLPYVDNIYELKNKKIYLRDKEELQKKDLTLKPKKSIIKKPILEIKNISFITNKKIILDNISFNINKGEKIAIVGENGIGKSTILKIIARLIKPTKGEVIQHIDKKLGTKKASRKWFKKVGFVYQDPNYQLFMPTVIKEISFGAKDKKHLNKVIEIFELDKLLKRHPQSLSEGEKRLITIAAIVSVNPEIIILDEPTVGQDLKSLNKILNILNYLNEKYDTTIILTTHDKRTIDEFTTRVLLLKGDSISEIKDINDAIKYLG